MSKVKRYALSKETCDFEETKYGCFVWIDDYEKLESENEELKRDLRQQIELNALAQIGFKMYQDNVDSGGLHKDRKDAIERYEKEVSNLKAEVERLTAENESLQTKATNTYNAMVVRCKVEEITHKANADSIISQGMMSEAMKLMEESVATREQVERLTKAGDAMLSEWASGDEKDAQNFLKALVIWNAAKDGKQS